MSAIGKVAVLIIVGFFGFITIAVAFDSIRDFTFFETHSIVADLPNDPAEASKALRSRIELRFPDGTDTRALRAFLVSQGFGFNARDGNTMVAQLTKFGLPRSDWFVTWQTDSQKRIVELKADCLLSWP